MKTPVTIGLILLLGSVAGCATATGPDGSKRYGFELPDMLELSLYVTLGGSYRRVGDLREARRYFEEGLEIARSFPKVRRGLTWTAASREASQASPIPRETIRSLSSRGWRPSGSWKIACE